MALSRLIPLVVAAATALPLSAQQDRSDARLRELVSGLTVTPRVLIIGARPEDADADLIAWLARGRHVQTGYLSLTRGESGTNHAGVEATVALGAIRTEEALAARRIDGGEQFFTRAYDFGPARSAAEVFARWNRDTLLANIVGIVRSFRPHVIVSRFTADTLQDGHREAAAMLAREVFDAALDTIRYRRATFGMPWSPTALYEPGVGVSIDARAFDHHRGVSFAELATRSRAQLRSTGFLSPPWLSPGIVALRRVSARSGAPPAAVPSIFDGVDTSFARLDSAASPQVRRSLAAFVAHADSARDALGRNEAGRLTAHLARASELATIIRNAVPACRHPSRDATVSVGPRRVCAPQFLDLDASADLAQSRANEALLIATGVAFDVVADREFLSNRDTAAVTVTIRNHGDSAVTLNDVTVSGAIATRMTEPMVIAPGGSATLARQLVRVADAHPWWVWARKASFYPDVTTTVDGVPHADLMPSEWGVSGSTVPENIRRLTDVVATLTLRGTTLTTSVASVVHRTADAQLGMHDRAVSGVPAVTLAFERAQEWTQAGRPMRKQLRLVFRSFSDREVPMSFKTRGAAGPARLDSLPSTMTVPARSGVELRVPLKGTPTAGRHELSIVGVNVPDEFAAGFRTAQYPHLPAIHLFRNSTINLQAVDVEIPARLNVAYVRGPGEDTDVALKQLGIPAYVFNDEGLLRFDLSDFTTIVIGPGAYEINRGLYMHGPRFEEFMRKGGTLVVMSNPVAVEQPGVLPLSVKFAPLEPERVNAPDAPVRAIDSRARLLNWPNVIREPDWSGWVGARAVALPSTADARFSGVVAMNDAGEPVNRNALLVAPVGKGRLVYTSITFPQQIANGVHGAMRLLVNILSAGMPAETKLATQAP